MEFKDIISVPGTSGLYKVVGNNKNGFIIESLSDKKRTMINASQRIMTLVDVAIYTTGDDLPLLEVFKKLQETEGKNPAYDTKGDQQNMRAYFKTIVPEYDEERVYTSDIKKVLNWYLLLKDEFDFSKIEINPEEENEKLLATQEHEKPIHKIHEAHGPKAEHAKTTTTKTRKKV